LPADNHWREKFFQRRPGRLGPLIGIKGPFARGAFAPAFRAVRSQHANQDYSARRCAAKTGFKKVNQREVYFAEFNRVYEH